MRVQRIAPIGSIITHFQTKCSVCGYEWKKIVGVRYENERCPVQQQRKAK